MPPVRKRAGDLTGRETERLQAENAAELKEKAKEMALMAEVREEMNEIPIDYTNGPIKVQDEVEIEDVVLESPTRTIIPNTNIEQMTFGAGNYYDFAEGKKYTVSVELARHLQSKGLLWEGSYR